jgi:hypothetical protein
MTMQTVFHYTEEAAAARRELLETITAIKQRHQMELAHTANLEIVIQPTDEFAASFRD